MSDFFDAKELARAHDDLIREHRCQVSAAELQTLSVFPLVCLAIGVAFLWWVLR